MEEVLRGKNRLIDAFKALYAVIKYRFKNVNNDSNFTNIIF